MFLSFSELFKIGIGPSSSHTVGPMVAAGMFLEEIRNGDWPRPTNATVTGLQVSLHGSLAFTGKGHASDNALILGLAGEKPDAICPDAIAAIIETVQREKKVRPSPAESYLFDPKSDLIFDYDKILSGHSNGMTFFALDASKSVLLKRVYYSIGGGFVVEESELNNAKNKADTEHKIPYPFSNAEQMLEMAKKSGLSIAQMKRKNEDAIEGAECVDSRLNNIWQAMRSSVERGMENEGILPGGLHVRRRAPKLRDKLESDWQSNQPNPLIANDWLQLFAMAVNEENAAGSKVVTAPTNGAAGVIPAVLSYYFKFFPQADEDAVEKYLLTSAAIGGIIKHNASISGAEVGCQGEIGSAAAMAAAGLAAVMGGTPEQVENAAEIALEHHLGMTCDPVAGLVQVPCIERNGMGAIKAVAAASLALKGDGQHVVCLDTCIETMRQTGIDMHDRYKETSQGGLAVNVVAC